MDTIVFVKFHWFLGQSPEGIKPKSLELAEAVLCLRVYLLEELMIEQLYFVVLDLLVEELEKDIFGV